MLFSSLCLKVSCISLVSSPLGKRVFSQSVLWASLRQVRKTGEWVESRESLPAASREGLMTFPWAGSLLIYAFVALPCNPILVTEWGPLSPIQLYYRSADQRFRFPRIQVCSCPIKHSRQWQLLFIPVAKWRPGALFWEQEWYPHPKTPAWGISEFFPYFSPAETSRGSKCSITFGCFQPTSACIATYGDQSISKE